MASNMSFTSACAVGSPKKSKKKGKRQLSKHEASNTMGCSPSQAVIVQTSATTRNSHLHPTIFMVGEKSFQLLRDLGELNFYQLAQNNEAEETAVNLHGEFARILENPTEYLRQEHARTAIEPTAVQENMTKNPKGIYKEDSSACLQSSGLRAGTSQDDKRDQIQPKIRVHFKELPSTLPKQASENCIATSLPRNQSPSTSARHEITTHLSKNFKFKASKTKSQSFESSVHDDKINATSEFSRGTQISEKVGAEQKQKVKKAHHGRNRVKPTDSSSISTDVKKSVQDIT